MKKLHVGVIGLGIGRGHIKGFNNHPGAEVIAIADLDEKKLDNRLLRDWPIPR